MIHKNFTSPFSVCALEITHNDSQFLSPITSHAKLSFFCCKAINSFYKSHDFYAPYSTSAVAFSYLCIDILLLVVSFAIECVHTPRSKKSSEKWKKIISYCSCNETFYGYLAVTCDLQTKLTMMSFLFFWSSLTWVAVECASASYQYIWTHNRKWISIETDLVTRIIDSHTP